MPQEDWTASPTGPDTRQAERSLSLQSGETLIVHIGNEVLDIKIGEIFSHKECAGQIVRKGRFGEL